MLNSEFSDLMEIWNEFQAELNDTWRKLSIRSERRDDSEEVMKQISRLSYELGFSTTNVRIRKPRIEAEFVLESEALLSQKSHIDDLKTKCSPFISNIV